MPLTLIDPIVSRRETVAEGVGDVSLPDFTIYGYKNAADGRAVEIHDLVVSAEIIRSIDTAPTLTIDTIDPERLLASISMLSYRCVFTLDRFAYELAQIKKKGDMFILVFEDAIVASMRRRTTTRKIAAGTMSRVEFGYLLLSELPPVDFVTPGIDLSVTKTDLARGKDKVTPGAIPEDTYKALLRIFGVVRWRFWVDAGKVFAAPDTYLMSLVPAARIMENHDGIEAIDFDLDVGKPVQKAEITALSDRWSLPIGARIEVDDPGPSSGGWIVSEYRRSLFSPLATITVVKPLYPLPEPVQSAGTAGGNTTEAAAVDTVEVGAQVAPKGTLQAYAARQAQKLYGWGPEEFQAIDWMWTQESHWDATAQNPSSTAFGIAQFLDTTWAGTGIEKTSDPYRQIDAGLIYIKNRYGTPRKAMAFWKAHRWY